MRIEYLGSSACRDVFPNGQPANDGNPDTGIFADALENADNIGGGCFELSLIRHGAGLSSTNKYDNREGAIN